MLWSWSQVHGGLGVCTGGAMLTLRGRVANGVLAARAGKLQADLA